MRDSKGRKCVRAFKYEWENVNDEPRSSRPSLTTERLINALHEKICEDRLFSPVPLPK